LGTMVPYVRPVDRSARFEGELTAMQAVADALTALPPEARERVLQWAADLFRVRVAEAQAAATPVQTPAADAGLSVAGVEDLFERRPASPRDEFRIVEFVPRADKPADAGVDDDLTLGSDVLDFAEESKPDAPAVASATATAPATREPQPVLSMLHSFVEDFQKLAREWESD
jgi:hypothetical protein